MKKKLWVFSSKETVNRIHWKQSRKLWFSKDSELYDTTSKGEISSNTENRD